MSFRIQSGQSETDTSSSVGSAIQATGGARSALCKSSGAHSDLSALGGAQETAMISANPEQLSGELPIRQDRVDALRHQIEAGTYTVNPHALANAMFQDFPELKMNSSLALVPARTAGSCLEPEAQAEAARNSTSVTLVFINTGIRPKVDSLATITEREAISLEA